MIILPLVDVSVRLYYQKGRRKFEKVAVKHEKREKFFYYLVGMGIIPIFYYLLTSRIDTFRLPFPARVRWLGAGIVFAGNFLFIWSHRALGSNWSPILEIRKEHTLVTNGPYRFVRHPMYAAIFIVGMDHTSFFQLDSSPMLYAACNLHVFGQDI